MEIFNLFRILLYVGPIQIYLHLKMGLPPVLKAGSVENKSPSHDSPNLKNSAITGLYEVHVN